MSDSSAGDVPLYKSYFLGLDKIGLDSDGDSWRDNLSDISNDSNDIENFDRIKSAPMIRATQKWKEDERPKSCFPILNFEIF